MRDFNEATCIASTEKPTILRCPAGTRSELRADVAAVLSRHLQIASRVTPNANHKACFQAALRRLFPAGLLVPENNWQHFAALSRYEEVTGL